MRGFSHRFLVFCALLGLSGRTLPAQPETSKEKEVKAAFLFNFAQFVEWPGAAFSDAHAPLIIGLLGDDPFGGTLDATVQGETVNGRPLLVQRYRRVEEIKTCHILFISDSEKARLPRIFATLKGRPILTAGDSEGFARSGGMIRFITEKRVRFRINREAAAAAGLTISSKMLRAAEILRPEGA